MQQAYRTLLAEELTKFIYVPEDIEEPDGLNDENSVEEYEEDEY